MTGTPAHPTAVRAAAAAGRAQRPDGAAGSVRGRAAALLRAAEEQRRAVPRLTTTFPGLDTVDAYEIQLINIRARVTAGVPVRGHKVGLSSKAMQDMMGVDEPDYGHLLADMFVFEGTEVDTSALVAPRVEVEPAFVLGAPLPAPGCNAADVLRCTAFIMPALEIIDSRIEDWSLTLPDTIADNASSGRVVLGGRMTPIDQVDLRDVSAALYRNGVPIDAGNTSAILGNPVTAVAWLANKVHDFGVTLEAGHVILPGSCTRAHDVAAGDQVRAEFETLGDVTINFR